MYCKKCICCSILKIGVFFLGGAIFNAHTVSYASKAWPNLGIPVGRRAAVVVFVDLVCVGAVFLPCLILSLIGKYAYPPTFFQLYKVPASLLR